MAERLRKAIARCKLPLSEGELQFTVSLGATRSLQDDTADALIKRVRMSLNEASLGGRNCCYAHDGQRCEPADEYELAAN